MRQRIDRQGVNVGNKMAMAFWKPSYNGSAKRNIVIAGDIASVGSLGNIMPVFTDKRRLHSTTKLFDMWEVSDNITFTLDSYVPEIDRMAGMYNIASSVPRDEKTHERALSNSPWSGDPITPRIVIFPSLQNLSPPDASQNLGGQADYFAIIAEGIWYPSDISWDRGNLIQYNIEFQPDVLYVRTVAISRDQITGLDFEGILTNKQNADRYHDFTRDEHYIDGVNQNEVIEERMGLLPARTQ